MVPLFKPLKSVLNDGHNDHRRRVTMSDWLWFIGFIAAYIVLMRWVLPRFGIST
jgi:hypothetical protein